MRMRAGVLTGDCPSDRGEYTVWAGDAQRENGGKNSVQSSLEDSSSAEQPAMNLEQLAERVQSRTPLRSLVRWVAGIRASVHSKLLAAFLMVTSLFVAVALVRLQPIVSATQQCP